MVLAVGALGAGLVVASEASADEAPLRDAKAAPSRTFESSAGLKGLVGGNLWTTPENIPGSYEGLGFAGSAGGFGWGAALYYEARIVRHLGLEVDLGYDSATLQRNVTYNGVLKVDEKVQPKGFRASALVKGIAPAPFGRVWLGIGPELLAPSSADASLEIKEGGQLVSPADEAQLKSLISAKTESSTMFLFGLGLVFHVSPQLEIPVDLRAAKNLSQESDWQDRVAIDLNAGSYEVTARTSWDFRLGTGLGYRF